MQTQAVYLALGIILDGKKEFLGLWSSESEGAKFWLSVFNELRNRSVEDRFIACVDGRKELPEAIEAVFPHTQVQLYIMTLCALAGAPGRGGRPPRDLWRRHPHGRRIGAGALCRALGRQVSDHKPELAGRLGLLAGPL